MDEPNTGGRPRKEIDIEELIRAVEIHCTREECAHLFDMDEDTLTTRIQEHGYEGFSAFYKRHQSEGKRSLRRAQWEAAVEDKQPTMLVWLGKQYLGQKDTQYIAGTEGSPPLNVTVNALPAIGTVRVTSGPDS